MSGGKRPFGYTIVEVLIVLAVSGFMFVIASTFINGKQAKTAFNQSINEMASRIEGTASQVTDGQYSDVPLNCTFSGGITDPNQGVTGSEQQGQNTDCVFLGKIIHFAVDGKKEKYETFSLAGGRVASNGTAITCLVATPPDCPTGADPTVIKDLITQQNVSQSMDVKNIRVSDADGTDRGRSYMIGFIQGQGTNNPTGSLQNGAASVSLYFVNGASDSMSQLSAIAQTKGNLVKASKVQICLTDGERYAGLRLGEENGQFSVSVKNYGTVEPAICVV